MRHRHEINFSSRQAPSGQKLRSFRFSTDGLRSEHRFDAWRNVLFPLVEAREAEQGPQKNFKASIEIYDIYGLFVGRASHTSQLSRATANIEASPVDHILLKIPLAGSGVISGFAVDRPFINEPKSASILDFCQPMASSAVSTDCILIFLPRASAEGILHGNPANIHGQVVNGPSSVLLSDVVGIVLQNIRTLTQREAPDLRAALEILIGNVLRHASAAISNHSEPHNLSMQQRIRKHISDTITSETLTPDNIASRFNISLRTLYSLFEPFGGVATYIRETRLKEIHWHLNDLSETRPIKTIAAEYGFHDEQHFSRLFRAYFNYTARTVRRPPSGASELFGMPKHPNLKHLGPGSLKPTRLVQKYSEHPSYVGFLHGDRGHHASSVHT